MKAVLGQISGLAAWSLVALVPACSHNGPTASHASQVSSPARADEGGGDDDDTPVQQSELPAPVQTTVAAQAKGLTIHGLSKSNEDGRLTYELELVMPDGHRKDMDILPDGTISEIEEEVQLSQVPDAAKNAIQNIAGTRTITRVEAVSKGQGPVVGYEIGVRDGTHHAEFRVAVDGNRMDDDDD